MQSLTVPAYSDLTMVQGEIAQRLKEMKKDGTDSKNKQDHMRYMHCKHYMGYCTCFMKYVCTIRIFVMKSEIQSINASDTSIL